MGLRPTDDDLGGLAALGVEEHVAIGSDTVGGRPHALADGQYGARRDSCEKAADLLGVNAITGDHARWCGPASASRPPFSASA